MSVFGRFSHRCFGSIKLDVHLPTLCKQGEQILLLELRVLTGFHTFRISWPASACRQPGSLSRICINLEPLPRSSNFGPLRNLFNCSRLVAARRTNSRTRIAIQFRDVAIFMGSNSDRRAQFAVYVAVGMFSQFLARLPINNIVCSDLISSLLRQKWMQGKIVWFKYESFTDCNVAQITRSLAIADPSGITVEWVWAKAICNPVGAVCWTIRTNYWWWVINRRNNRLYNFSLTVA